MGSSIVRDVTKLLEELFSPASSNFWLTVYPAKRNAGVMAPSNSGDELSCREGPLIDLSLLTLKKQLLAPFTPCSINQTFWSSMSMHVVQAIAGPLFSYSMEHSNERDVKAFLIEPVVRELTRHLSSMNFQSPPAPGEMQFVTTINMEQPIKLHGGSGRPATVDFMVAVRTEVGRVLKLIPGEAKIDMRSELFKHCKQLSVYLWKVATNPDIQGRAAVGVIIDHHQYRIAFSPLLDQDGRILPITFISPPINWRNIDLSPVAVSSKGLLLLSTLFTLVLDADSLSDDSPIVDDDPPTVDMGVLNSVCTWMHKEPFVLRNPSDVGDVLRLVEDLEKVKTLAEQLQRQVNEQKVEIAVHKQKITQLSPMKTPGRKRKRLSSLPPPPPMFDLPPTSDVESDVED